MHGLDPPFVHRDLKCANIFVDGCVLGWLWLALVCVCAESPKHRWVGAVQGKRDHQSGRLRAFDPDQGRVSVCASWSVPCLLWRTTNQPLCLFCGAVPCVSFPVRGQARRSSWPPKCFKLRTCMMLGLSAPRCNVALLWNGLVVVTVTRRRRVRRYNESVDIYALGMCVLEMFMKRGPFSEVATMAQLLRAACSVRMRRAQGAALWWNITWMLLSCLFSSSQGQTPPELQALEELWPEGYEFVVLCLDGEPASGDGDGDEEGEVVRVSCCVACPIACGGARRLVGSFSGIAGSNRRPGVVVLLLALLLLLLCRSRCVDFALRHAQLSHCAFDVPCWPFLPSHAGAFSLILIVVGLLRPEPAPGRCRVAAAPVFVHGGERQVALHASVARQPDSGGRGGGVHSRVGSRGGGGAGKGRTGTPRAGCFSRGWRRGTTHHRPRCCCALRPSPPRQRNRFHGWSIATDGGARRVTGPLWRRPLWSTQQWHRCVAFTCLISVPQQLCAAGIASAHAPHDTTLYCPTRRARGAGCCHRRRSAFRGGSYCTFCRRRCCC